MQPTEHTVITAWICPVCKHMITQKPITQDKIEAHLATHKEVPRAT